MRRTRILAAVLLAVPCMSGCNALLALITSTVSISIVNDTALPVDVTLVVADQAVDIQNDINAFFAQVFGDETTFTIQGGGIVSVPRSCADAEAVFIKEAEQQGSIFTAQADTDVVVMGTDFSCGDEIVFTISPGGILGLTDIDISVQVR
ncbi:MAG: hypothetical protein ACE5E6_02375 [Phycisphaerae bacterium]